MHRGRFAGTFRDACRRVDGWCLLTQAVPVAEISEEPGIVGQLRPTAHALAAEVMDRGD
jgi:hypothetical protein